MAYEQLSVCFYEAPVKKTRLKKAGITEVQNLELWEQMRADSGINHMRPSLLYPSFGELEEQAWDMHAPIRKHRPQSNPDYYGLQLNTMLLK